MKIGFPGILFIVFLILKLTDVIAWSWWWVTSPLWAVLVILIAMMVAFVINLIIGLNKL